MIPDEKPAIFPLPLSPNALKPARIYAGADTQAQQTLQTAPPYLETPVLVFARREIQSGIVARGWSLGPTSAAYFQKVVERVLDTYEWLLQGGLAKKLFECVPPNSRGVWMKVDAQLKACLEEIGEEEGSSSDETLVTLIWSYDWLYRSGLFEQVKELASTALSWFDLGEDDHEKIEDAMKREEPEDRFCTIQGLYLQATRSRGNKAAVPP